MKFELDKSIEVLEKTPLILEAFLSGLSENWIHNNEGKNTWSPYDVIGHLIFGEKTDWIVRIQLILSASENKMFEPFDRYAQLNEEQNLPISQLTKKFIELRSENIKVLKSLNISKEDLKLTGIHPELGTVTIAQLIATWTVHDLGHIAQISRVMSKQYKEEVGPWVKYLGTLNK